MSLEQKQFSNKLLHLMYYLGWVLICPWYWLMNYIMSLYIQTSSEKQKVSCCERCCLLSLCTPFLMVLVLVLSPFMLIGLALWIPLGRLRQPYIFCHSFISTQKSNILDASSITNSVDGEDKSTNSVESTRDTTERPEKYANMMQDISSNAVCDEVTFSIATLNTCLLPEAISRSENLSDVWGRASKIAAAIINQTDNDEICSYKIPSDISITGPNGNNYFHPQNEDSNFNARFRRHTAMVDFAYPISINFDKNTDFVCLQEVFDPDASSKMISILRQKFCYILHDAKHQSCTCLLNSGLLIASRYPIIDADFKPFEHSVGKERIICKGVLMAKVELGKTTSNKKLVGFIANTHLQAFGSVRTRSLQMDEIMLNLQSFHQSSKSENEVLLFDILCGDFNFDRMSFGEEENWKHEIFNFYQDPCVDNRGNYKQWVIGTKLFLESMHLEWISTPDGLKRALENDGQRQQYVDSVLRKESREGMPQFNGKRKLDLILYCPLTMSNDMELIVEEFSFVTAVTTLTDHIPCTMKFCVRKS